MSDKQLNFENANVTITIDLEKSNTLSDIEEKNKRNTKTTTIRCSQDNSNYINALTKVMDVKSVDEMLSILIDNYIPTLTHNEQADIKTIKKVYDQKK